MNSFNPALRFKHIESANKSKLIDLLPELKDFKFATTLVLRFKKIESDDKTKYGTFYSNSKVETIINESDTDDVFESIDTIIISNINKSLGNVSSWITDSVTNHSINTSEYNPVAGSSYIKSPKELNHSKKVLINFQNINDNECFKWCLVRY